MIIDNIKNKALYENSYPLLKEAFAFIEEYLREEKPVGRYELKGKELYAMVQEYETKVTEELEAHRNYIDLQFVAEGEEKIYWAPLSDLTVSKEYNPETDAGFYHGGSRDAALTLRAGDFAIFFPEDAHKPGQAVEAPAAVKKIVVKIKY